MTSSLVGSEMCIRDRVRSTPTCTKIASWSLWFTVTSTWAAVCMWAFAPVSYTHLTLPTICSV
eukprot:9917740-Prorocentrum_lima.AAC.1